MHKLVLQEHTYLTENILKSLSQNRITTVLDFLREDVEKLSVLSKLSLPQILEIRNNILTKYSAPLIDSSVLWVNKINSIQFIKTGIESLDAILNNGIPVGFITEVCGLAGCGKTQLCLQISINCARHTNNVVLYIDTKGDFSAVRVQKILQACNLTSKDMAFIMLKIKIVHLWHMEDLVKLFEEIKSGTLVIQHLSLIIIDSLPSLMFQHFGDDNKIGLNLLNKFVNCARCVSKVLEVGVVCVNIQTRWIDQEPIEADEEEHSSKTVKEPSYYTEKRNRCLGYYWQNIPHTVLFLEKCNSTNGNGSSFIQISVSRYTHTLIINSCKLEISSSGVK